MKLPFSKTYLGELRAIVGDRLLLVPGFRIILENSQEQVLLAKRIDFDKWGLPAGHPEKNETIFECMVREVKEETGLQLNSASVFGFASDPKLETCTYPNGDMIHNYSLLCFSRDFSGTPCVSDDEMSEVRFFSLDALPDRKEILANELRSIEHYEIYKTNGEFQWL